MNRPLNRPRGDALGVARALARMHVCCNPSRAARGRPRTWRETRACGWLPFALIALAACRDTDGAASIAPTATDTRSAQLVVSPALPGDSVVTVTLRMVNPGATAIASITATIDFDTTRVRFLSDASLGDGALRAANAVRGRLIVAAAHPTGFAEETVARLRFVSRDSVAMRSLALGVTELHLTDARDARTTLRIIPTAVGK